MKAHYPKILLTTLNTNLDNRTRLLPKMFLSKLRIKPNRPKIRHTLKLRPQPRPSLSLKSRPSPRPKPNLRPKLSQKLKPNQRPTPSLRPMPNPKLTLSQKHMPSPRHTQSPRPKPSPKLMPSPRLNPKKLKPNLRLNLNRLKHNRIIRPMSTLKQGKLQMTNQLKTNLQRLNKSSVMIMLTVLTSKLKRGLKLMRSTINAGDQFCPSQLA